MTARYSQGLSEAGNFHHCLPLHLHVLRADRARAKVLLKIYLRYVPKQNSENFLSVIAHSSRELNHATISLQEISTLVFFFIWMLCIQPGLHSGNLEEDEVLLCIHQSGTD